MSFRQTDARYKQLVLDWWQVLDLSFLEGEGIRAAQVDNLMLTTYRLYRHINNYLRCGLGNTTTRVLTVPKLPEAFKHARKLMSNKDGLGALFNEADALEALSRSAYQWLKENNRLVQLDVNDGQK